MTFYAFGLNYETASLSVRECFALSADATRSLLGSLALSDGAEVVVLSTCNRTEAYLYGSEADVAIVKTALASAAGEEWKEEASFCVEDEAAVVHVLRVAAGLKSMVVGDVQILAQMKDAYRLAVDADRVGTVLHRLMHTAFRTAKRVLSSTGVGAGAVSVSSAAVALAKEHFGGGLTDRRVLLVGAGEVGQLVLQALRGSRPASITIVNRSREHASAITEDLEATIADWEERHTLLNACDLAIVATSAETHVISGASLRQRAEVAHETLVMDLGVPRNVDPAVEALPGFRVLDMDALEDWTKRAEKRRRLELPKADFIVQHEMAEFVSWMFHQQALQPAIQAIRQTFEEIRRQEIERHHHRFSEVDRAELDQLTKSIMQKLLAVPIVRLKASDPESVDLVRGVKLLQSFFARPDCEDGSAVESEPPAASTSSSSFTTPVAIPASAARPAQA